MLKIYWNPLSTPSNKVVMCANALELMFETVLVDLLSGEQMGDEYLKLNPFGKVPALDDDGFTLYESGAILRYLARKQKSELYPSTYEGRALVDQWCDFSSQMVLFSMQKVFYNRVLAPMLNQTPNDDDAASGVSRMEYYFPIIDSHLSKSSFLAGDSMTLADITLLSMLDWVEVIDFSLTPYPHLEKWRNSLRAERFYTSTHKYYGEGILPPKD